MSYDRLFMNLSASEIYAIVDVGRWEAILSSSFVYRDYRILQLDDARDILRRVAQADSQVVDELVHAFIEPCFETRNYPDDYLLELLERELGHDSLVEDGAPPWGARMYVLQKAPPDWLQYEPEPEFDADTVHQAAMEEVRARPRGYVVFEFVTEDGAPVSGQRCEVLLADGEFLTRSSDAQGQLRLDNIPQGECHLRLVDLDGSAWSVEKGEPPKVIAKRHAQAHVAQRGEDVATIAHRYGVSDWKRVWEAADNESLRKKRKDPGSLRAGDNLVVPAAQIHEIVRSTDATHRVVVRACVLLSGPWSA